MNNIEIPEFRIKLNNDDQEYENKSRSRLYEITDDSKIDNSQVKLVTNPSPSEKNINTRNSVKKMEKLNTLTVDEMKSKLRARSVSKANNDHNESGEMERQSLSQIKKNRYGKHSSSSLLKEKIGSNNNYFLNSVKLNANMSNKNIIKLEYDTKESIVKNQLISDKPITMKVTEAKIIETWRDFDEASEPMTPVKFVDTINKEFKTNNSNIVNFVSKKNRKSPKKKKNKLKNISVPSYIEKIEEANETSKKKPIKEKITKKIQLKENYKIQPLQDKSKISNEVKPPNTIRYWIWFYLNLGINHLRFNLKFNQQ